MSTENLDASDLHLTEFNGIIREDVMEAIADISRIPLPFSDSISSNGTSNQFSEWTRDVLAQPDVNNKAIDGADTPGNDTSIGDRVGNHHQILTKVVRVSTRARAVNTVGFQDTLSYQVQMRQQELFRDYEAIMLQNQGSVRGTDAVEGELGGFPAWLTTSTDRGVGGADGGFDFSTGLVDPVTPGEARALSEESIRDIAESVFIQGGNASILMSVTPVIRRLSNFMFTTTAQVATIQRNTNEMGPAQAQGSVNVFILDHGTILAMVANRLQQTYDSADVGPVQVANVFIYDPSMVSRGVLTGANVEPLAKTGLAENSLMSTDVTLIVNTELAHGVIADIDPTLAVVG